MFRRRKVSWWMQGLFLGERVVQDYGLAEARFMQATGELEGSNEEFINGFDSYVEHAMTTLGMGINAGGTQTKLVIVFPTAKSRDAALAQIALGAESKLPLIEDTVTTRKMFERTFRNHMAAGFSTVYCVTYDSTYRLLDNSELLDFVYKLCTTHQGGYKFATIGENRVYEDSFDALPPTIAMDNITLFDWEIKVTNYY